ncbi:hypothetical protein BGZ79_010709 [Entomortierella chlamydospora]|nr:hypothetical protein BGZ79_010709 [Entomortierella chlamydospora]
MQRTFILVLLGLLCLSNVLVQGQGATQSATTTAAATSSGSASGSTTTSGSAAATGTATATRTASGSQNATATGTGTAPTSSVTRTPSDPLSSLTMLNPKANVQDPPLFQIGTDIQFAWSYDKYLLLQPTNITIEAFMTNSPTVIITIGAALPGSTTNYTWPAASQLNASNPISTAMYTLRIFDGAVGRYGSLPDGGYLATYSGLKFGLYAASAYTPGSQMNPPICATCQFSPVTNAALAMVLPYASVLLATVVSTLVVLVA